MKPLKAILFALLLTTLCYHTTTAQNFGTLTSAVYISNCNQNTYYNTTGTGANPFNNTNLGVYTQGSGSLVMRGAQVSTFKDATANVCAVRLLYRIYLQSATPGPFSHIDLPFFESCNAGNWSSGGACNAGDQRWQRVRNDGESPVDLTMYAPGNYILEVYYEVDGSQTTTTLCNEIATLDNGGNYYKAAFTIQKPDLLYSTNPTTCNGSEGSIILQGLASNTSYQVSYLDDGATRGPITLTANAAGQATITGLNAGLYATFSLTVNGCSSEILTGVVLSNPIFVPSFNAVPPFCEGTPAPVLPAISNNGIPGTWSPTPVSNQTSGLYTFTPAANTCAVPANRSVTVLPRVTPVFSFGTSLTICGNGTVPTLPATSLNGINGSWNPSLVNPNASGTYVFTPSGTGCYQGTTFTVTVNPNINPTFAFGNNASICTAEAVPALPTTSNNGITGSWSPAVVSNTTSGTYTFTPDAGQCALPFTYTQQVFDRAPPVFSFGGSANICAGDPVPILPNTSNNGLTGTWSPAVVSNTTSGTYTFTTSSNPCVPPVTFTVTVYEVIAPTFAFGASIDLCNGQAAPVLPTTSTNGLTGTWSPATINNSTGGTYTFTSTSNPCAPPVTITVTVNPVIPAVFAIGNSLTICSGDAVPALPTVSSNGISGTWAPAVISNTASGVYVFNPGTTDPCTPPYIYTVTVNPIVTPSFSFGTSASVCIGITAPVLPNLSSNGITGTWSPAVIDNQNTGTYTFTPAPNQCATPMTFSYEVNPIPSITNGSIKDTTVYDGDLVPAYTFNTDNSNANIRWTNSNTGIGLAAQGTGTVPSFKATNTTDAAIAGVVTATPYINGCNGPIQIYRVIVLPLEKDLFVPNVFSPNNDGKNDLLLVYGNYIASMQMHIFNQWGEHITTLNNKSQGWDGRFKGKPQPVGVYVYVLKAVLTDGRKISKKGSITLLR